MKKVTYFLFLTVMFFVLSVSVSASEVMVITGYDVRFREGPTTNSRKITSFNPGVELMVLDKNAGTGNGCNASWYKGQYDSDIGYVCSEFVELREVPEEEKINPEDYKEYSDYLKEVGFPDTYISKLVELHAKHPTWQFEILNVNYDFTELVKKEYDGYYKGWSLIEDTGSYYDGYKSFDSWSYNYLNNTFSTAFNGGGKYWYAASKETIAYYLDPRNFLTDKYIFMFETLSYNDSYHTKEGIELMLKGTFMESGYADSENQKTFVDAFMDASVQYNISPYVLISRVIQEVGAKGSTIVSGTVPGYEGYYNFYNINAAGNNSTETIVNGLIYAKEKGWDTKYKAIIGGAYFLVKGYVEAGQDTLYLQKWDVIGPDYVNHQYMQNIQAPSTESIKTYSGYNNMSLIESAFAFTVPVFKNMPSETKLPNKGNPNNYLLNLSVNGTYMFSEPTDKTEFEINLDVNTTSADIAASKVYSGSTVIGSGSVSLSGEEHKVEIMVRAENGDVRTYTINITRNSEKAIAVSEIIRLLNIKNDGSYMYGLELGTDISSIKKNIIDREPRAEVSAFTINGEVKTEGIIASGDKIKIKTASEEKEYVIVIYGDVNSDGKIDKIDAAAILRYYYNYTSYDGVLKMAADVDRNGVVDKVDVAAVLRNLYGYDSIKQ